MRSGSVAGRDRDRRVEQLAGVQHEAAGPVDGEVAVAGQRGAAVGELDLQVARAADRDVQRAAACVCIEPCWTERPMARRGRAGAEAHALGGAEALGVVVHEIAERDADVLVARRVDVREIVRDRVETRLLCRHAGGSRVHAFKHCGIRFSSKGGESGAPASAIGRSSRSESSVPPVIGRGRTDLRTAMDRCTSVVRGGTRAGPTRGGCRPDSRPSRGSSRSSGWPSGRPRTRAARPSCRPSCGRRRRRRPRARRSRRCPVAWPPAVPVNRASPCLRDVRQGEAADRLGVDGAVGGDLDRLALGRQHLVALRRRRACRRPPPGTRRCACSARRAAVWTAKKPSPEIARSSGSPVSRTRLGREVGDLLGDAAGPSRAARPSGRSCVFCSSRSPNDCCCGAVGLVARRRGVGQVVGDLVLADHLGDHAGRGDVEARVPFGPWSRSRRGDP